MGLGSLGAVFAGICAVFAHLSAAPAARQDAAISSPSHAHRIVDTYCLSCHNEKSRAGGLTLSAADAAHPEQSPEVWERVVEKLRAESMPPPGRPRPDHAQYVAAAAELEARLDRAWAAHPNPGRIGAVHRLNRTEYVNAIRDLFQIDPQSLDIRSQLPGDETADGSFDKFADVLSISTAHLERYMSVSRQVTRLATRIAPVRPTLDTFEIPLHVTQEDRQSEDLPLGSRGGIAVRYQFPSHGEYVFRVRLQRNYQDYLKGMGWEQQLDVRLDGTLLKRFEVGGKAQGRPAGASYAGDGEPGYAGAPEWEAYMQTGGDAGLEVRVPVTAGMHTVGVSFVRATWEPEGLPQPLQRGRVITNDEVYMGDANVAALQIGGPFAASVSQDAARGARRTSAGEPVFICRPARDTEERACADRILSRLARLAYRRSVTTADLQTLRKFFDEGREAGGSFEAGIQFGLERMLVDPDFLLRVYRNRPAGSADVYRLSDIELASRLSFFLWSSIPDDRLLTLAEQQKLHDSRVLEGEVRRMLNDPRAVHALVDDFAAQWLNLRRVAEVVVDPERYPTYDLTLMASFRRETELFVGSTIREDRSVTELLNADYTFVNEKLARHYGIPGVYGSRFRRVAVPDTSRRGGLLAHGALLATTSYPDRTSPVLRGKFLLNNIFGLQTAPPPEGVDTNLAPVKVGAPPPAIRERLAEHRTNAVCASCHSVIDPLGFALENFDVIGGWRALDEAGNPVDAKGTTIGGRQVDGLNGLREFLLAQPDQFPRTVTEKLMAYALGRRVEPFDRPAVRQIVRDAAADRYRWSSIILGIVRSPAFQLRRTAG